MTGTRRNNKAFYKYFCALPAGVRFYFTALVMLSSEEREGTMKIGIIGLGKVGSAF